MDSRLHRVSRYQERRERKAGLINGEKSSTRCCVLSSCNFRTDYGPRSGLRLKLRRVGMDGPAVDPGTGKNRGGLVGLLFRALLSKAQHLKSVSQHGSRKSLRKASE